MNFFKEVKVDKHDLKSPDTSPTESEQHRLPQNHRELDLRVQGCVNGTDTVTTTQKPVNDGCGMHLIPVSIVPIRKLRLIIPSDSITKPALPKPHRCSECSYQTDRKSRLTAHIRTHTGEKPLFKCSLCPYNTTREDHFVYHQRTHSVERPFHCIECNYRSVRQSDLDKHLQTHTEGKPYHCDECNYRGKLKSYLVKHKRKHHKGDKLFRCLLCPYKTADKISLVFHNRVHSVQTPFKFPEFHYSTSKESQLNSHLLTDAKQLPTTVTKPLISMRNDARPLLIPVNPCYASSSNINFLPISSCSSEKDPLDSTTAHKNNSKEKVPTYKGTHFTKPTLPEKKLHRCSECSYQTDDKSNLKRHNRTHTGEKPFKCSLCPHSTSNKSNLKVHLVTHSGDRPFHCNECSYQTVRKSRLTAHTRNYHTDEKPFKCSLCPFSTSRNDKLKIHQRTHSGERPYACNECSYCAKTKGDLNVHLRTHTGERPFKCSMCSYRAARNCTLKVHQRTHFRRVRAFGCNECNYRSSRKSHMVKHIRVHSGDKPFKCSECSYNASEKSNLKRHLKTHTTQVKPKKDAAPPAATRAQASISFRENHANQLPTKETVPQEETATQLFTLMKEAEVKTEDPIFVKPLPYVRPLFPMSPYHASSTNRSFLPMFASCSSTQSSSALITTYSDFQASNLQSKSTTSLTQGTFNLTATNSDSQAWELMYQTNHLRE